MSARKDATRDINRTNARNGYSNVQSVMGSAGGGMDGQTWQSATSTTTRTPTAKYKSDNRSIAPNECKADYSTYDDWRERQNSKQTVVLRNGKRVMSIQKAPRIVQAEPVLLDDLARAWLENNAPEEFKHLLVGNL